ncbi:MAG: flavin reductase family protein [Ktedonobacteraceae bacterium]
MIAPQDFKRAMAQLTEAVTVITTCDEQGQPWGFTATAFSSLSLNPPLVLCCLSRDADCYQAFLSRQAFAVNILDEHQQHLAQRFATKGRAKYYETQFTSGKMGLPLLADALVMLECSIQNIYPGGDHSILVGLVEHGEANSSSAAQPLLYYAQAYGSFASLAATRAEINGQDLTQRSMLTYPDEKRTG